MPAIVKATPNVYLDTSQTVDHPEAVFVKSTAEVGRKRVLFRSDAPAISPEVNLKKLERAWELYHLAPDVAETILRGNVERFLEGMPIVRVRLGG
ncbi:MAG: amidohydrolase family protein [Candidatus Methylomirabilales bacterium]